MSFRVALMLVVLLVVLALMAWGFRTILLGLLAQSAARGNIIPVSLSLARVPVPSGETFVLSLPARRDGESFWMLGSLVLTSRRVRLVRRGSVVFDLPLAQVAHLTVQGWTLRVTVRSDAQPVAFRVAQPAVVASLIRTLAVRASA